MYLFGRDSREAFQFAMNRIAEAEPAALIPLDRQWILNLEAAIEKRKKNSSPRFFGHTYLGDAKNVFVF
jgi:hypothetical protein